MWIYNAFVFTLAWVQYDPNESLTTSRGGFADLITICPQSVVGAFRLWSNFHVIKDNPSAIQSNFNVMYSWTHSSCYQGAHIISRLPSLLLDFYMIMKIVAAPWSILRLLSFVALKSGIHFFLDFVHFFFMHMHMDLSICSWVHERQVIQRHFIFGAS